MTLVEDNAHLRELLGQWNEAFGAECYNDALVALSAETEKAIKTELTGTTSTTITSTNLDSTGEPASL